MNAQKVMIIVLVVLAMAFVVVTVGLGGSRPRFDAGRPPKLVDALKGLQGGRFLTLADATTTCGRGSAADTLVVSGACRIDVADAGRLARGLKIAFDASGPLRVRADPRSGPSLTGDLPHDGRLCYGTSLGGRGGTLTLQPLAANVLIALRRESCPSS